MQCVIYQWICLNDLGKLMWFFFIFKFWISVWIFYRKQKCFQTNSEAWILIKVQCVIYQWIRIDKLYKLIESFIQISNSFSNYWPKTEKYLMHNKVGFMQVRWGRHLCWSAHVLVFIYFALILHDLIEKNNVLLINKLTRPVIKIEKWKHNKTLSVGNLVCV